MRHCRGRTKRSNDLKRKIDINKEKEKMEMKWVKRKDVETEEKIKDGYAPSMDANPSSSK